jgi:DNA repair protein RecO (recombination protein O)
MGPLRTEAIVLRSIRYGEADRILHLYTPEHGRLGAIAKGARRARSRFGARLEPCLRVRLMLHQGRSELLTVTAADTLATHGGLRRHACTLDAAARACDAVERMFDSAEPHPEVFALLARMLALLAADPAHAAPQTGLSFRLKLLLAAGLLPQLAACAACGEREHLGAFSATAGGVVCSACEATGFPLGAQAYEFLTAALARPLARAPEAPPGALRQADRAIVETLAHHAHVRLRPLLGAGAAVRIGS